MNNEMGGSCVCVCVRSASFVILAGKVTLSDLGTRCQPRQSWTAAPPYYAPRLLEETSFFPLHIKCIFLKHC